MKSLLLSVLLLMPAFTVRAADVDYRIGDDPYQGFYLSPAPQAPLVLLLHDWDGLTDYEIRRARMLAEAGYAVFAADLFGAGVRPTEDVDKRQHTGELYQDRNRLRDRVQGAIDAAAALGANVDNSVIVGYCFGGAAALEMARAGTGARGYVSFHGGLGTPEGQDYSRTRGQVLVLHGAADAHIGMAEFADLAGRLEQAGTDHEMIAYGGAEHAFTVFEDSRYHARADSRAWRRFLDFLTEITR